MAAESNKLPAGALPTSGCEYHVEVWSSGQVILMTTSVPYSEVFSVARRQHMGQSTKSDSRDDSNTRNTLAWAGLQEDTVLDSELASKSLDSSNRS